MVLKLFLFAARGNESYNFGWKFSFLFLSPILSESVYSRKKVQNGCGKISTKRKNGAAGDKVARRRIIKTL